MLFLDGKPVDSQEANLISSQNRSFKYGDALFETVRIYQDTPLFVEDHMIRLLKGMKILRFDFQEDEFFQNLRREIYAIIQKARPGHGRLRIHVFRGGSGAYLPTELYPHRLLEVFALKHDFYEDPQPVRMTTYKEYRITPSILTGLKTANSLPYILASIHAREKGFDDALMFSGDWIAEASSSNLFYVSRKKLYTPDLDSGCLDGVCRKQILRLAREIKVDAFEKKIRPKDLFQADEIFLTNTIRGIVPVVAIDEQAFPQPSGSMTAFLARCFQQMVQTQI